MTFQIQLNEDAGYIDGTYSGNVDAGELNRAFAEIVECVRANQEWHVLLDLSKMTGGHTLFDLHALAEKLTKISLPSQFREAIVLPKGPGLELHTEFWRNLCSISEINVKNFDDRESAEAWLAVWRLAEERRTAIDTDHDGR